MTIQKKVTDVILSAVFFLIFFQFNDLNGQIRRTDRLTPTLTVNTADSIFDKSVIESVNRINGKDILSLIYTLAADSFEGRATGSRGFGKAATFVLKQFEESGLKPIGSSYFQKFRIETRTVQSKIHLQDLSNDSIETMNVIGLKRGALFPDEYTVIAAHLDHLGKKQDSVYHGANDNASGVAVMLTVARALKDIPTKRSVLFIAFTGEEVGLMGSAYFVTHPPIDLRKIRFMVNLDLVGSGSDGIMIQGVDGHDAEFSKIQKINQTYFQFELSTRPNSPNSDQYYFHVLGVPAFFIYAYNGTMPYHSPGDTADKIDAAVVENITKFVLMNVLNHAK